MSDLLQPGLGTYISLVASLGSDLDAATYAALTTWEEVGEVTEVPTYGALHDVVTHVPLKTGITAKYHGALNNGSLVVPMGLVAADAGQVIAKAALASKARISVRVTYADGAIDYYQAKIMGFTRGASIGGVVAASMSLEIETVITEVAA